MMLGEMSGACAGHARACAGCGYDLRGQAVGGACPECGAVERRADAALAVVPGDRRTRRRVATGLRCLFWSGLCAWAEVGVLALACATAGRALLEVLTAVVFAEHVLWPVGVWLASRSTPGVLRVGERRRVVVGVCAGVWASTALGVLVAMLWAGVIDDVHAAGLLVSAAVVVTVGRLLSVWVLADVAARLELDFPWETARSGGLTGALAALRVGQLVLTIGVVWLAFAVLLRMEAVATVTFIVVMIGWVVQLCVFATALPFVLGLARSVAGERG